MDGVDKAYAVQAGRQVVRAYQPVVSNPKSTAQSIQRAKGNLVGRISKITPWQILEGLGDNKFNRRSRFLRLLLRKVTAGQAAGDPSQFNAKLADADFVFSEGTLVNYHYVSSGSAAANAVTLSITKVSGVPTELADAQGLLVVVVLKQESGVFESVLYKFMSPSELVGGSVNITVSHGISDAYTASVYVAPFGSADGSMLPTVSGDLTSTATSLDALLAVGTAASSVVWGMSSFSRNLSFTPTTAASARKKAE